MDLFNNGIIRNRATLSPEKGSLADWSKSVDLSAEPGWSLNDEIDRLIGSFEPEEQTASSYPSFMQIFKMGKHYKRRKITMKQL